MKPDHDILTRYSAVLSDEAVGGVYRDRNESMRSFASTLELSSCTSESHSYISVVNSENSSTPTSEGAVGGCSSGT